MKTNQQSPVPEFDLLGQEIKQEQTKKKVAPVPVVQRPESVAIPYRPCTVTRLSKTLVMVINDDCAHMAK